MNAECRSKLSGAAIYILVCFTVILLALFRGGGGGVRYESVDCWDAEDNFPVWCDGVSWASHGQMIQRLIYLFIPFLVF